MLTQGFRSEVALLPDGGFTVRMRFPRRGVAVVLCLMGLFSCLTTVAAAMMVPGRGSGGLVTVWIVFLLASVGATIGCGLGALYVLTRRRQVNIAHGDVIIEKGWCLGTSTRRHRLSEFRGFRGYARDMGALDAGSLGPMLGAIVAGAFGTVLLAAGSVVTLYFLELVHDDDTSENVPLTSSRDASAVAELADWLSSSLGLPLLTRTLDLYVDQERVQAEPEAIIPVRERGIWSEPTTPETRRDHGSHPIDMPHGPTASLPAPPDGMRFTDRNGEMEILLPPSNMPLVTGGIVGGVSCGISVLFIIVLHEDKWQGIIPLALGCTMLLVCAMTWRRRSSVVLSSTGILYRARAIGSNPVHIPWASVRDVSVARTRSGAPGVLVATDGSEESLAAGMSRAGLNWLAEAIRQRARAEARRRSGSQWAAREQVYDDR